MSLPCSCPSFWGDHPCHVISGLPFEEMRVGELIYPPVPVQMTNMSHIWRSSASEDQDRVGFYCSLHFLRKFQKIGRNSSHFLAVLHVVSHLRQGLSISVHSWGQKPYLSANQEAGCYCQAVCEVINGVGKQIEVSTNLQRERRAPDKGRHVRR